MAAAQAARGGRWSSRLRTAQAERRVLRSRIRPPTRQRRQQWRPDKPALKNLNIQVKRGETVALVGPSGAGKSTLFEMLFRFYDPQQGVIKLGDTDIRLLELDALRRLMPGIISTYLNTPNLFHFL